MADAKIGSLMKSYAARGGVSAAEIKKLSTAISSDLKVSKAEYQALLAAKKQYGSAFSPATAKQFDRLLNPLSLSASGKVVNKFHVWAKAWKVDQDAGFRQKWGVTDANDIKAPNFVKQVNTSKVPADLRARFTKQVGMFFKEKVDVADGGGKFTPRDANSAAALLGRDGKQVGWELTWSDPKSALLITQYYRNDGTPAGGEQWPYGYQPYD